MQSYSEISLYVDSMIVEAIIKDPSIIKKADASSVIQSLVDKVKDYFSFRVDPDKTESVLNYLAPGAIYAIFDLLGKTWYGILFGLAQQVFGINVGSILMQLYEYAKSLVSSGNKTTSQNVDSVVESIVKSNTPVMSAEDQKEAIEKAHRNKSASSHIKSKLRDARMIKLAMIDYQENLDSIQVFSKLPSPSIFPNFQSKIVSILITLFSWVFKIAFASAGLIVAGDAINKFLGRPSSVDTLLHPSVRTETQTQTKHKLNPSYHETQYNKGDSTWAEGFVNNYNGISDMLVKFTKEVYDGLSGYEDLIKSTESFQEIARFIEAFNSPSAGAHIVFIPREYTSKKQIVNLFIDDVFEKIPKTPK